MNTLISDLFLPVGVSWRLGEPRQSDICSAAGSSEKETATTRTPPPFSCPKQFCSGPKFAYLTQPNKGPDVGELTLFGEGRLMTYFHLTCPTELSPSYTRTYHRLPPSYT